MFKEIFSLSEIKQGDIVEIVEMFGVTPGSIFRGVAAESNYSFGWSTDVNFPLTMLSPGVYKISLNIRPDHYAGEYIEPNGTVNRRKLETYLKENTHVRTGLVGARDFVIGNRIYLLDNFESTSEFVQSLTK